MNVEGVTDKFEYVDQGVKQTAMLTNIDMHSFGPFTTTDDPHWNIYNSDGKNYLLGLEWLPYTLENGRWRAKVHAQYNPATPPNTPASIGIWFEHCNVNTGDCHDDGNYGFPGKINFYDWDGHKWEAQFLPLSKWPARPQFMLKRLT